MEPNTLRLPANTWETLDEEASEYGFRNRSEYIRHVIEHREAVMDATAENTNRIRDRLDDLEARLADVEAAVSTSVVEGSSEPAAGRESKPKSQSMPPPREHDADEQRTVDDQPDAADPLREQMEAVLADLDVPGRSARVERVRREAISYAWDRLRKEGHARSRDLANDTFGQFFDDPSLNYSTSSRYPGYQMWDNCVRDCLRELPGVYPPGARGERWQFEA